MGGLRSCRTAIAAATMTLAATAAPAAANRTGDDGVKPYGPGPTAAQHGGSLDHLPAVRENLEIVSKLPLTGRFGDVVPGQIADVAVYKGFAYLNSWIEASCTRGGVYIVDIRDPAHPEEVGFVRAPAASYHGEGAHVATLSTSSFKGDLLAVNNEPCDGPGTGPGGFDLIDVTNPRDPRVLSQGIGDTGPVDALVGDDEFAHSSHSIFIWQAGTKAFAVFVDNVETTDVDIFEITDPANPVPVAEYDFNARFPQIKDQLALGVEESFLHDMVVKQIGGRHILLASYWDGGYVTVDVTDPGNPTYIGDTSFDAADPLLGFDPPVGNAHQAEFSHDNRYFVAADEDFAPYRPEESVVTSGLNAGQSFALQEAQVPGVEPITPENPLLGKTKYVGTACAPLTGGLLPSGGATIAVVARGTCLFQDKLAAVEAAGYTDMIVFNNNGVGDGGRCEVLINMALTEGTINAIFVGRKDGLRILNQDLSSYQCTDGPTTTGDTAPPPPGTIGGDISIKTIFDGWGYAHLFESGAGKLREVDAFAIEEATDPRYFAGFGDLSIHEFATDPTEYLAYSSYYAGGVRVLSFGPDGLKQVGKFIDEGGSNFWGIEQFTPADGERLLAASDRDLGLYILRYTGPGAAKRPECKDVSVATGPGVAVRVPLVCTDANGNPLTLSIASQPQRGSVSAISGGGVGYTPRPGFLGTDTFTYTAFDGAATAAPATVSVEVLGRLPGGACANRVIGTVADDILSGTPLPDAILGGRGNDRIDAGDGDDCISGEQGNDRIDAGDGDDQATGGTGADRLLAGSGDDAVRGNSGRDQVRGDAGDDRVRGDASNDALTGGAGDDAVIGGTGNDSVRGDAGNDRLRGDAGNDRLYAGSGSNTLSGGSGNDRISAVNGRRDTISCGAGADRVRADRSDRVSRSCERVRRFR